MEKSKGHLAFVGQWEFFRRGDDVYRVDVSYPFDIWGYRQGARWECYSWHADMSISLAREAERSN
jgi:hypothetical protein